MIVWLDDHRELQAALVQVVGLIVLGFIVNKWLADYNERKTASLERYKLQIQIAADFARYSLFAIENTLEQAVIEFILEHGDVIEKRNAASDLPQIQRNRQNNIDGLIGQSLLARIAFHHEEIFPLIKEMNDMLITYLSSLREGYRKDIPKRPSILEFKEVALTKIKPIETKANEVGQLMTDEVIAWLG